MQSLILICIFYISNICSCFNMASNCLMYFFVIAAKCDLDEDDYSNDDDDEDESIEKSIEIGTQYTSGYI